MGVEAESVSTHDERESHQHAVARPEHQVAFDPVADRVLRGSLAHPSGAAARSLRSTGLKTPILQRAQRFYGNRASQQIVMRSLSIQRQCGCGGTCDKCKQEEEQRAIQRKSESRGTPEFDGIPNTHGEPLAAESRSRMGAHFETDLSDVRVHTSSEASASAASLDALAYTSGRDIYFAKGTYVQESHTGQRLLAHEVAHVVQQSSGKEPMIATKSASGVRIGAPEDGLEAEADREAERFMSGSPDQFARRQQSRSGPQSAPGNPQIQRSFRADGLRNKQHSHPLVQRQPLAPGAQPSTGPVAAINPMAQYSGLVLALEDEPFSALSRSLRARELSRQIRQFEATPEANQARLGELKKERLKLNAAVTPTAHVPVSTLAAAETRYAPTTDFAKEFVVDLRNRIPAGILLRDETLRRFMTQFFPETAMVDITVPDPAGETDAPTMLQFTINAVTVDSRDGFLRLRDLDKAAGKKLEGVANTVAAEAASKEELASLLVAGPLVTAEFGTLAKSVRATPKDYAIDQVDHIVRNLTDLHQKMVDTPGDSFAAELAGYAQKVEAVRVDMAVGLTALREFQKKNPCQTADESAKQQRDDAIKECRGGSILHCSMINVSPSSSGPPGFGGGQTMPNEITNRIFDLLSWGAITDMDNACKAYREGKISLTSKENLTTHAMYKAAVAIGFSLAAGFLGGWLGGVLGAAAFGARTLGATLAGSIGSGILGGVGGVGGQDIYSATANEYSTDPVVRQYMQMHTAGDYLRAGGYGGLLAVPFGLVHYYGTPRPGVNPSAPLPAGEPVNLFDASGKPIRVSGGQILPPTPSRPLILPGTPEVYPVGQAPPTIYLPSDGVPATGQLPTPVLQSAAAGKLILTDAAGRPLSVSINATGQASVSMPSTTTLLGEPRIVGASGQRLAGQVPPPVQPLVDAFGHPIPPPPGPVIVDLQAGTPAFLRQQIAANPGARGVGVEPGNYLLAYQGIYPKALSGEPLRLAGGNPQADLQMALMIARNTPVWPDTPAWRTSVSGMPRALPWEMDPAAHLFPQQGPVIMLPDPQNPLLGTPFFPAQGRGQQLVPYGLNDISGFGNTAFPQLEGVDQMYLRRAFGLGLADAETTAAMGRQISQNLTRQGSFIEIRATRASEVSVPTEQAPGALDQPTIIAEQIPGGKIYRVTEGQIRGFQRTGKFPPGMDPIQQDMIRNAARDTQGLGRGDYRRLIRIYRGDPSSPGTPQGPPIQRKCACGGTCDKCKTQLEEIPSTQGEALEPGSRARLETHFDTDLSEVRVHTGSEASASVASLDAQAFATGRDIYFARGMYAPSSANGQRLLAHEVAHVVQQGSGKEPAIAMKSAKLAKIGAPDDGLEVQAEQAAEEYMRNDRVAGAEEKFKRRSISPASALIQRAPEPDKVTMDAPLTAPLDAVCKGIDDDDVEAVVAPMRGLSLSATDALRKSVIERKSVFLERWLLKPHGRQKTLEQAVSLVLIAPVHLAIGATAEEGLRRLWHVLPLIDQIEVYDEGYREIEQAQVDVIRQSSLKQRKDTVADPVSLYRLKIVYSKMNAREEFDSRNLMDSSEIGHGDTAVRMIQRADDKDTVYDALLALDKVDRRFVFDQHYHEIYELLGYARFNLVATLTHGTEAQALVARLRLATEDRDDDMEAVRAMVDRAVALLGEQQQLREAASARLLTADDREEIHHRLEELGDLDSLVQFWRYNKSGKLKENTFMALIADAENNQAAFGADAMRLAQFSKDPRAFAMSVAKQRVLMAGSDQDALTSILLSTHAPALRDKGSPKDTSQPVADPKAPIDPRIRAKMELAQWEDDVTFRQELLTKPEVQKVLGGLTGSELDHTRRAIKGDEFLEKLDRLNQMKNNAQWGEFFDLVGQIARKSDLRARFLATASENWSLFSFVSGDEREIMLEILKDPEHLPIVKILQYTGKVSTLKAAFGNIPEKDREQLRTGWALARHPFIGPLTDDQQAAIAAFTTFEQELRRSQESGSLLTAIAPGGALLPKGVDKEGVEDILAAVLGDAPTKSELSSPQGLFYAAAILGERVDKRLGLSRGISADFTETDETMDAAGRQFAALWIRVRDKQELTVVEYATLLCLYQQFDKRSQEFSEASKAITDLAGTIAATLAGIVVVIATGGAATPAVIAMAAAAGAAGGFITREAFGADYYVPNNRDLLLDSVNGALAVVSGSLAAKGVELMGLSGRVLAQGAARVGEAALQEAVPSLSRKVVVSGVEAALDGAFSGTISEGLATFTDDRAWRNGIMEGLARVGKAALLGGAFGLAGGAVLGSAMPVVGRAASGIRKALFAGSLEKALIRAGMEDALKAAQAAARKGDIRTVDMLVNRMEGSLVAKDAALLRQQLRETLGEALGHPPGRAELLDGEKELLASSGGRDTPPAGKELEAEKNVVSRSEPQISNEPGYVDEVDLGNGHTWRRAEDGTWCRFTAKALCGTEIPAKPPSDVALYRALAKEAEEHGHFALAEAREAIADVRQQHLDYNALVDDLAGRSSKGKKFSFNSLSETEQDVIVHGYPTPPGKQPDWDRLTLSDLQRVRNPPLKDGELLSGLDREMNKYYQAEEEAIRRLSEANRDDYKTLRDATPPSRLRDRVISRAKGVDEVSKLPPPSKALDVDHIVPLKKIWEMKGFQEIRDWEDMIAIANYEKNLKAVDMSANRSRGEDFWHETGWSKRTQYTSDALKDIMAEEQKLIGELQAMIDKAPKKAKK